MDNFNKIQALAKEYCDGHYDPDVPTQFWKPVFEYIVDNHKLLDIDKSEVHGAWFSNAEHIRRKVNDDNLLAKVLKVTLPVYNESGLTVYRGTSLALYNEGKLGFCWSKCKDCATRFSIQNADEHGGVLLEAYAPKEAIFTAPNAISIKKKEFEYTCDPRLLKNVKIIGDSPKTDGRVYQAGPVELIWPRPTRKIRPSYYDV